MGLRTFAMGVLARSSRSLIALGLASSIGCGGPPPPPAAAPAPLEPLVHAPSAREMELLIRLAHPLSTLERNALLFSTLHPSFTAAGFQKFMSGLNASVAELADFDAPFDMLTTTSPEGEPDVTIAFGVARGIDVERRLAENFVLDHREFGLSLLQPRASGPSRCALVRPLSSTAPRFVCSWKDGARKWARYLTETVASRPAEGDVEMDVPSGAMRGFPLADQLPPAPFAAALASMHSVLRFADEHRLDMTVSATWARSSSVLRLVRGEPGRMGPPPTLFYELPRDSTLAGYYNGSTPGSLNDAWLAALNVLDPTRDEAALEFQEMLADILGDGAPLVFAMGLDAKEARRAAKALRDVPPAGLVAARKANQAALGPWFLFGFEGPPQRWEALMKHICSAGRPGATGAASTCTSRDVSPERDGLPSDTLHEVTRAREPVPAQPEEGHFFLGSAHGRTWIAFAASETVARERLRAQIDGSTSTLATMGMTPRFAEGSTVGGLVTYPSVMELLALPRQWPADPRRLEGLLDRVIYRQAHEKPILTMLRGAMPESATGMKVGVSLDPLDLAKVLRWLRR